MDNSVGYGNLNVNLEEVNALNHSRSVTFVNTFVSRTADFLNQFSAKAEENLATQTLEMQKLEIAINIIEEKLSSIPSLKDFKPPVSEISTAEPQPQATEATDSATVTVAAVPVSQQPEQNAEAVTAVQEEPVVTVVEEENFVKVKDDPRYIKYFKMLNVGVPKVAVSGKMKLEGLDPDLLDTPDAPCPAEAEGSDDDFSDNSGSTASDFDD